MFGGALFEGNSKLFDFPLGVVKIGFNGYDLGKTTEDAEFTPDQDVKDILFQQDGTKPSDHVRTGIEYILSVTLGEIKTGLLVKMMSGLSTENTNEASDSGTINRSVYQSMRDTESGVLKIASVDANGVPSENAEDIIYCYEAIPIVDGALVNWGADSQRALPMQFRIKWHPFDTGESSTKSGAFGYWGDPTTEDVPVAPWPDVEAPAIVSATATSATDVDVVFSENIAFQSAFDGAHYAAKVEGAFVLPSSGTISTTTLSLVFPASTFTAGDEIELSISDVALQDTEATPNTFPGVDSYPVTNSV
jgi:hypothetical protein